MYFHWNYYSFLDLIHFISLQRSWTHEYASDISDISNMHIYIVHCMILKCTFTSQHINVLHVYYILVNIIF